ncbi:hypothetical protein EVAR_91440_1 [Eumeta japonica]|uniref:Uncharacterized protein n=1 Tax=Eumeta variegata TaxID=151549 RepID=A0A4C1WZ89_EUMVA|nr:hypothetical protein EVAR_91440_1 [Eumeta japonica]
MNTSRAGGRRAERHPNPRAPPAVTSARVRRPGRTTCSTYRTIYITILERIVTLSREIIALLKKSGCWGVACTQVPMLCTAAVSLLLGRICRWSGREIARSAISLARSAQAERDNESCFIMRAHSFVHVWIELIAVNFDPDHVPVIDVNSSSIVRSYLGPVFAIGVTMPSWSFPGHGWQTRAFHSIRAAQPPQSSLLKKRGGETGHLCDLMELFCGLEPEVNIEVSGDGPLEVRHSTSSRTILFTLYIRDWITSRGKMSLLRSIRIAHPSFSLSSCDKHLHIVPISRVTLQENASARGRWWTRRRSAYVPVFKNKTDETTGEPATTGRSGLTRRLSLRRTRSPAVERVPVVGVYTNS